LGWDEPAAEAVAVAVLVLSAAMLGFCPPHGLFDTYLGEHGCDGVAGAPVGGYPGLDAVLGSETDLPEQVLALTQSAQPEPLGQELGLRVGQVRCLHRRQPGHRGDHRAVSHPHKYLAHADPQVSGWVDASLRECITDACPRQTAD
jgi:hypothetical protein